MYDIRTQHTHFCINSQVRNSTPHRGAAMHAIHTMLMYSNKDIQYVCACTYTNIYLTRKHLPHTYTHLDFTIKCQQMDIPHRVASSAHVSHLALQSPAPAVAHLCWWWAEQSQGLHQLCCSSCACTGQPSGVKGQIRSQTVVNVQGIGDLRSPIYFYAHQLLPTSGTYTMKHIGHDIGQEY